MRQFKTLCLIAFAAAIVLSCKKEEETTTYSYMTGSILMETLPAFVSAGDSFTFHASGVSLPDTATVELKCKFKTSAMEDYVISSDGSFIAVVPDTTGTFTVTCSYEASGYYGTSLIRSAGIVVDTSLTAMVKGPSDGEITDARDSRNYLYRHIGSVDWLRSNAAYGGTPLLGAEAAREPFGAFFTWEEAADACPADWRLPSADEFSALDSDATKHMWNASFNSEVLWPEIEDFALTDESGFSALPLGYATVSNGTYTFTGKNSYAVFWASDGGAPCCFYLYNGDASFMKWTGMSRTDFAANVRCVR